MVHNEDIHLSLTLTHSVCVCVCVDVVGKLSLYSGVLALGVGDSMAAVAGSLMGKTKWPGIITIIILYIAAAVLCVCVCVCV